MKSFKVVKRNAFTGEGQGDTVYEVQLADKDKALELLAKHFKLLTDVQEVEHRGTVTLAWKERPAREPRPIEANVLALPTGGEAIDATIAARE